MESRNNSPLFTLRGHNAGVTALAYFINENNPYLISGDDEGTLNFWDLNTFRRFASYLRVASSRIQSLKVVNVPIKTINSSVLVVQSREDGLQLFNLNELPLKLEKLIMYPTFCPLFSRGDASNINQKVALLAYPACLGNHLVTIRLIGNDAETLQSGTAHRFDFDAKKTCSIFDITLVRKEIDLYLVLVAYEDGCLCLFKCNLNFTVSVPHLQVEGLRIDLIKTYDFQIGDFISAFDAICPTSDRLIGALGSPHADLIFLCDSIEQTSKQQIERVKIKKRGVSAIKLRPDNKVVAVACWDSSVSLYSMESHENFATLSHHSKQVQCMLFVDRPNIYDFCSETNRSKASLAESKEDNKHLLCCASIEGTISISAIY